MCHEMRALFAHAGSAHPGSDPITLATASPYLNPSAWIQNGSIAVGPGVSAPDAEGGSLISLLAVPGADPSEHEEKMVLGLTTAGGTYVSYVNATPDGASAPPPPPGRFTRWRSAPGAVSATGGGWATATGT